MTDATEAQTTQSTRITVALIPKANDDLVNEAHDSGLGKTDIVNRSATLYRFIMKAIRAGDEILIRHPDGTADRVHLL